MLGELHEVVIRLWHREVEVLKFLPLGTTRSLSRLLLISGDRSTWENSKLFGLMRLQVRILLLNQLIASLAEVIIALGRVESCTTLCTLNAVDENHLISFIDVLHLSLKDCSL